MVKVHGRRTLLALACAVVFSLIVVGIGIGTLIDAHKQPAKTTAAEVRPPEAITMALSRGVWHCIADGRRYGLVVTSTTGGIHAPGSYHYQSLAADQAGPMRNMLRLQHHLYSTRRRWLEVIGPHNAWDVKNGNSFTYSYALQAQHQNHVHCAGR